MRAGPFSGSGVGSVPRFREPTRGVAGFSIGLPLGNVWICPYQTFDVYPIFSAFMGWTFFYIGPNLAGSDMLSKTRYLLHAPVPI